MRFKVLQFQKNKLVGFTLIELIVSMSILSILSAVGIMSYQNSLIKSRDVQRKEDLNNISKALELFYNDYGKYPSDSSGLILACPYSTSSSPVACAWGSGAFADDQNRVYVKKLPIDPSNNTYIYRSSGKTYQLFARLENTNDKSVIVLDNDCGSGMCNYAVTSSNTSAYE